MRTNNARRWTQDELDEISDKDFIRHILRERILRVRSGSAFHKRIAQSLRWLQTVDD